MRIRSPALLLGLIALFLCAVVSPASARSLQVGKTNPLRHNPPVSLPLVSPKPAQPASPDHTSAPLPRTGIDLGLVLATGSVMLALGAGLQRAARNQRP